MADKVTEDPWLQELVEVLAGKLDMNRRLATSPISPPKTRRTRRSREVAISEAASRWKFNYEDDAQ
jgi:hypothetical protein